MKYFLTVLLSLFYLSIFSQSPVVREEYFEPIEDDQWRKVSIVNKAYHDNGVLKSEQYLYYENSLNQWIPQRNIWYNEQGQELRTFSQFFQGNSLGFYKENIFRTYDENRKLERIEGYSQESKDAPNQLVFRETRAYIDDCSYVFNTYFFNSETKTLDFFGRTLYHYDSNCEFVLQVNTSEETLPIERLQNQIRTTSEPLKNGGSRRIFEQLSCPDTFDCADWTVRIKRTYNGEGQITKEEIGSVQDFFRRIISTDYQSDKTVITRENLRKANGQATQTLLSRDVEEYNLEERILSRKRFEPLSFDETRYEYDENGLATKVIYTLTRKDSTGIHTTIDTTNYRYQLYCDGLAAEQITEYTQGYRTRVTFSYLNPATCGQKERLSDFRVFPNPTGNNLNIESAAFVTGRFEIEIFDLAGKKLRTLTNNRGSLQSFDVGDLPNGIYQLSIQQDKERITQPIIIMK